MTKNTGPVDLDVAPLTPDRWADLETLFGPRGAVGGCWCMWWRLVRKEYNANTGEGNREAFRQVTERGPAPGLLAYHVGQPVGWVAVAPRTEYPSLERSPTLKRIDDQPVWSITCFFIARGFRRKGVMQRLIDAAVAFALQNGAQIVEAYPTDTGTQDSPDAFVFTGLAEAFRRSGFVDAARRSPKRPIMRWQETADHPQDKGKE